MPEKSLTVATYAAGASLAAITLIYVFGPTYFLDGNPSGPSGAIGGLTSGNRKKGVVGLSNPANDCFINSVLQALAGLGDLRLYLIREMHRRSLDEDWVYAQAVPREARAAAGERQADMADWKVEGLQSGIVTKSLKDIIDSLNERPIYKKTITAGPFVRSLEVAFRQRISRQQQDAQEFLQVVAERLCDEYHAGRRARDYARGKVAATALPVPPNTVAEPLGSDIVEQKLASLELNGSAGGGGGDDSPGPSAVPALPTIQRVSSVGAKAEDEEEEGFPMEGEFESQIECLTCGFKPRPTKSTFCTLTLNVPQTSSTTLNACFDGMFKTEYIDDFKCEKCRLLHAISAFESQAHKLTSETARANLDAAVARLQDAIETNPEQPPEDITLPDMSYAPKRRIARHIRLTSFPKIMAIHLSRSIYDASNLSQKNSAKVAFPERLPLGGLLNQRKYKLLAVVTHKGSHHSGHYESFRRQSFYPPFSNPNTFQPSGVYSKSVSPSSTPTISALQQRSDDSSPLASTPDLLSVNGSSTPSLGSFAQISPPSRGSPPPGEASPRPRRPPGPTSAPREKDGETASIKSVAASARSTLSRITSLPSSRSGSRSRSGHGTPTLAAAVAATAPVPPPAMANGKPPKRRKHNEKWWRISDEKVKEASTRDVLGMRREVYLLFYELERESTLSASE